MWNVCVCVDFFYIFPSHFISLTWRENVVDLLKFLKFLSILLYSLVVQKNGVYVRLTVILLTVECRSNEWLANFLISKSCIIIALWKVASHTSYFRCKSIIDFVTFASSNTIYKLHILINWCKIYRIKSIFEMTLFLTCFGLHLCHINRKYYDS